MRLAELRLGFVSPRTMIDDGDERWVNAGVGRIIEACAKLCGHLTLAMTRAKRRMPYHDYQLTLPVDDIYFLPILPSVARGFHRFVSCRRVIREVEKRSDVLIVQLPFEAPLALLSPHKPRVYHLCADVWTTARRSPLYRGYRRLPALAMGGLFDQLQRRLVRAPSASLLANGKELLAHYGNPRGKGVVSTALRADEIASRQRQRPEGAPFRVLFVGHLRHEKGIMVLLEAFEKLLSDVPDAELFIVGPRIVTDRGMSGQVEAGLTRLASKATVRRVENLEYGPDLFQCFADADVLALPSLSEGTPRVLVEARAFGCPVVASCVGGVPTSVEHGVDGLLVPPGDVDAMRLALLSIYRDQALRQRLVAAGYERARQCTVESFAATLCDEALKLVNEPAASGNRL